MLNRQRVLKLTFVAGLILTACSAPEPPPAPEEPPPAPPAPPPTMYDLGEADIVAEEPDFTSRNITFGGVKIGDITNDMSDVLGETTSATQNTTDHYVSYYRDGGLIIHTFKSTGEIRKIEIVSRLASEVASPQIRGWLEDGDLEVMREIMGGPEEFVDTVEGSGATEYAYDSRGIRFITYGDQNGIRFSYYRD